MVLRLVPYWRKPKQRKPKPQGLQLTVARSGPAGVVWKTYDTTQRIKYERSAKPRQDKQA
ncbi:Protein of unknown function [Pyronema omphalodes CBS 100304]|uniref:Uncharacterized protein n=1 Tax=Pyronema omphalodes (strain CBS 100304) TaxID=1076935 RepID=U4KVF1_PYROM|nr:Protein of unknown function [Pyronema omphalodes CBS 100304]